MKLFFDFDDYFFDKNNAYAPDLFALYRDMSGATERDISETRNRFSDASFADGIPYTMERHLGFLREQLEFDLPAAISRAYEFHSDVSRYLFDGTEEFLARFEKDDLCLLTFGDEHFQKLKVDGSGIGKYFREIIVTGSDKLGEIEQRRHSGQILPAEQVVFSDNRCEYFSGVKERGIIGIHLKRMSDRYSQDPCGACEYRVGDYQEFFELIERIRNRA